MVESNSFVSWCLPKKLQLTLAGLTRLCGWALGISVSCVTQLTTTTAFLLVPTIWILGYVFLSWLECWPWRAPAPRPSHWYLNLKLFDLGCSIILMKGFWICSAWGGQSSPWKGRNEYKIYKFDMRPVTNYNLCCDIVVNASCHWQESCGKQYYDPHSVPAPAILNKINTFLHGKWVANIRCPRN